MNLMLDTRHSMLAKKPPGEYRESSIRNQAISIASP